MAEPTITFGSRSIAIHLIRGAGAAAVLWAGFLASQISPWLTLLSVFFALWLMRGCPLCWTIGLFETLSFRRKNHDIDANRSSAAEPSSVRAPLQ